MKLQDKVALVTGAGKGLGGTIAVAMAREGARLVVCDIDQAALEETRAAMGALGAECLALRCDVSDSVDVDRMFEQAGQRFGTVDTFRRQGSRIAT